MIGAFDRSSGEPRLLGREQVLGPAAATLPDGVDWWGVGTGFDAADGTERVVWHWWNGSTRFPMTGVLTRPSTGFLVS